MKRVFKILSRARWNHVHLLTAFLCGFLAADNIMGPLEILGIILMFCTAEIMYKEAGSRMAFDPATGRVSWEGIHPIDGAVIKAALERKPQMSRASIPSEL